MPVLDRDRQIVRSLEVVPTPGPRRQCYVGTRSVDGRTVLIRSADGTRPLPNAPVYGFDWGYPSRECRRLADALLRELTDRIPPPAIRDALACESLAQMPWDHFSLSEGDLRDWIEARGYNVKDWPATPAASASAGSPDSPIDDDPATHRGPRLVRPPRRGAGVGVPRLGDAHRPTLAATRQCRRRGEPVPARHVEPSTSRLSLALRGLGAFVSTASCGPFGAVMRASRRSASAAAAGPRARLA